MEATGRQNIQSLLEKLAPEYAVERAYLFGSCARGDDDRLSDVDLCIEVGGGFTLFSLGGLCKRLEDGLGRPVDVVCGADSFYPRARERFERDKVLVYEGS